MKLNIIPIRSTRRVKMSKRPEEGLRESLHRGGIKLSLKELGGALGDFGPLHPFFLSYVKLMGLEPSSILLVMGVCNIVIGAYYKLPLPIEPQKAIAIYALAHRWSPSIVYATAFGVGAIWIVISSLGLVKALSRYVPECVARGLQMALAFFFLKESLELIKDDLLLGGISLGIILLFSVSLLRERVPATLILFTFGIFLAVTTSVTSMRFELYAPRIQLFDAGEVARGMSEVGFAQLFLTLSNAIIATRLAVNERFSRKIGDEQLAKNTGLMNILAAFLGCIPLCHGAGGFAAQYFYGARTGGAMIMEGLIELSTALLLSQLVVAVFSNFPSAIIGAMLLPSSIELGKTVLKLRGKVEIITGAATAITSVLTNLGVGFLTGVLLYYLLIKTDRRPRSSSDGPAKP
jgi:MFS superfamily sulfate permease-like transporter